MTAKGTPTLKVSNVDKKLIIKEFESADRDESENAPQQNFLTRQQLAMLELELRKVGEFGEVRLVVERGQLRYMVSQKSEHSLRYWTARLMET